VEILVVLVEVVILHHTIFLEQEFLDKAILEEVVQLQRVTLNQAAEAVVPLLLVALEM
jgi:hypothetical protein